MSHVQHFYPLMLCVKSWPATSVAGHFTSQPDIESRKLRGVIDVSLRKMLEK